MIAFLGYDVVLAVHSRSRYTEATLDHVDNMQQLLLCRNTARHIMRIRTCVYFLRFNHDHGIDMYVRN